MTQRRTRCSGRRIRAGEPEPAPGKQACAQADKCCVRVGSRNSCGRCTGSAWGRVWVGLTGAEAHLSNEGGPGRERWTPTWTALSYGGAKAGSRLGGGREARARRAQPTPTRQDSITRLQAQGSAEDKAAGIPGGIRDDPGPGANRHANTEGAAPASGQPHNRGRRTAPPHTRTAARQENRAVAQSHNRTTAQPHNRTTVQPCNRTSATAPLHYCTTAQPDNCNRGTCKYRERAPRYAGLTPSRRPDPGYP